jgi:hypothetical protein
MISTGKKHFSCSYESIAFWAWLICQKARIVFDVSAFLTNEERCVGGCQAMMGLPKVV